MRLGIAIQETWRFFNEIYQDLVEHYQTRLFTHQDWQLPIFKGRINHRLFQHNMQRFLQGNDVVFFEWASELLVAASHLPKRCGIVTRLHRYEMYRWSDKINWDAVDRIIVVSQAKEREFALKFPQHAAKLVTSRPSIALQQFTLKPKRFNGDIGLLCHLLPRKRVYDLILVFYELSQQLDGLHLHIGGGHDLTNQDYHDALHYLVRELHLEDKVTFYGQVNEPWHWYDQIDIFISNSYSEGLQVAPMEAMASGCYCLSHRWDGAEELLPQENLFFTNRELETKILQYCALPAMEKQKQRAQMRDHACAEFDIEVTKQQIRTVIDEVGAHFRH